MIFRFSAQIESPFEAVTPRNPANKNAGKLMTLTEFLEFAKTKAVHGVLISIQVIDSPSNLLHIYNNAAENSMCFSSSLCV